MTLVFEKTKVGQSVVLSFAKRIRRPDLSALEKLLLNEINQGCRSLLVDLSEVDHLTGTGLPKLVSAGRRLRGYGGHFAVAGPFRSEVQSLFERADLSADMRIVANQRRGVEWLAEQSKLQAKAELARELLSHKSEPARQAVVRRRRDLRRLSRLAAQILNA